MKKILVVIVLLVSVLGNAQSRNKPFPEADRNDRVTMRDSLTGRYTETALDSLAVWIKEINGDSNGVSQTISLSGNVVSLSDGGGSFDLTPILGDPDQTIQVFSFNASTNILSLQLSNDTTQTVDLSSLSGGGTGTDDQQISLVGDILTLEDGGTVDLSKYLDNTDNQTLSVSGSQLTISGGNTVNLPGGGGSGNNNLNEVLITSQSDLSNAANANKVGCIQNDITLTGNVTLADGLVIKNCGGHLILNGFELIGVGKSSLDTSIDQVIIDASTGAISGSWNTPTKIYAKNLGLKNDGVVYESGASITSGTNVLTVTGANFTDEWIGRSISVYGGVTGFLVDDQPRSQNSLQTTITAVNSATELVLADNATRTVSDTEVWIGTDNFRAGKNLFYVVNQTDGAYVEFTEGIYFTSVVEYNQNTANESRLSDDVSGWVLGEGTDRHKIIGAGKIRALGHGLRQSRLLTIRNTHNYYLSIDIEQDRKMHNYSGIPLADQGDDFNIGVYFSTASVDGLAENMTISNTAGSLTSSGGDLQFTNYIKGSAVSNFAQREAEMIHGYIDEVTGEPVYDPNSNYTITTDSLDLSKSQFETTRIIRPGRNGLRHYEVSGSSLAGWAGTTTPRYHAFYYAEDGTFLGKSGEQSLYEIYQFDDNVHRIHLQIDKVLDLNEVDLQVRAPLDPLRLRFKNVNLVYGLAHGFSNMPTDFLYDTGNVEFIFPVDPDFGGNTEDSRRSGRRQTFRNLTFRDCQTGYLNWVGTEGVIVDGCHFLETSYIPALRTDFTTAISGDQSRNDIFKNNTIYNGAVQLGRSASFIDNTWIDGRLQMTANNSYFRGKNTHNVVIANIRVDDADRMTSEIEDSKFTYDKPWGINLITDPDNFLVYNNVKYLFNHKARLTNIINQDSTYNRIEFGGSDGLKLFNNSPTPVNNFGGYMRNIEFSGARIERSIRDYASTYTYFPIVNIEGDDNYIEMSINLKYGLPRDVKIQNLKHDGWLQIDADQYPATDEAGDNIIEFVNYNQTIPVGEFDWINTGSYILDFAARDFKVIFRNSSFDLQVASNETGTYKKYFRGQNYGGVEFYNSTFKSASPKTIDFNDFPASFGPAILQDCDCGDITFIGRPGIDSIDCDGAGAGGGATNLSYTQSATDGTVVSDTGTDATIPAGSTTNASLMLPADKTKLDGVEAGAAADQTGTEIVAAIDTELGQTTWKTGGATFNGGTVANDIVLDNGTSGAPELRLRNTFNSDNYELELDITNGIGYFYFDRTSDGAAQPLRVKTSSFSPDIDASRDLSTAVLRWRNLYLSGTVNASAIDLGGTGDIVLDNNTTIPNNFVSAKAPILYNIPRSIVRSEIFSVINSSSSNPNYTIDDEATRGWVAGDWVEFFNKSGVTTISIIEGTNVNFVPSGTITLTTIGENVKLVYNGGDEWLVMQ